MTRFVIAIIFALIWQSAVADDAERKPDSGTKAAAMIQKKCTYSTWRWNAQKHRPEEHRRVSKPYSQVTSEEREASTGCTVCREDQEKINVPGIPSFYVCQKYADGVRAALHAIAHQGFPIKTIRGYAVGKSKGPTDENGLRTEFSVHSFGTAIDINKQYNGMYVNCFTFSEKCQLKRGGVRKLDLPETLTKDSVPVRAFRELGWSWGGDRSGSLKNYMHFSIAGTL